MRNAALIAMMFGAGLRVSEALTLRASDLDLTNGSVRVKHGKGDRSRTVALDPSAQAYVERWLGKRQQMGLNGRQPLFGTISKGERFGGPIDSSYVRKALPRLPTITAQLGHSSTAVTDRYLAKIAPADLIAQVRDRGRLPTS